ncbi:MAG: cytochrome c biogenesis protein CcdA [Nitratireductor sp.]|jgi:cytochrome c-type biogenesis protein|nr:cytochrome c biogenesis protein CcdA [Nitratireductor sp.]
MMMEASWAGLIAAFAAGIVSFLSPCVLPLVPGYLSYVAGRSAIDKSAPVLVLPRLGAVSLSLCFVLGFGTVFVILGASATALGQLLLSYRNELNIVGGALVIGFGVFTLGFARPAWMERDIRFHTALPGGRPAAAYVLGMAFAFGWTPCIGPILGAILTVSAASVTVSKGVALLTAYSLGLGVPFLVAAIFTDGILARLRSIGRVGRILQLFAGAVMILMGIAMITGQLSRFSYWMLDTFPVLANFG